MGPGGHEDARLRLRCGRRLRRVGAHQQRHPKHPIVAMGMGPGRAQVQAPGQGPKRESRLPLLLMLPSPHPARSPQPRSGRRLDAATAPAAPAGPLPAPEPAFRWMKCIGRRGGRPHTSGGQNGAGSSTPSHSPRPLLRSLVGCRGSTSPRPRDSPPPPKHGRRSARTIARTYGTGRSTWAAHGKGRRGRRAAVKRASSSRLRLP